jgi:hypothetical protein
LALALVGVFCLGFAVPALADDTVAATVYDPAYSKLTKVINAPIGTDTSGDTYTFHFAGGGTIAEQGDGFYSDGVQQDNTTLKVGDTVPTINDVVLNGVAFTESNTLNNGQEAQAVVQIKLSDILPAVTAFPHAGVYTYVVTESTVTKGATTTGNNININSSSAQYVLRIRVANTKTTTNSELADRTLTIEGVTVEQLTDDNGTPLADAVKINPMYPTTTEEGGNKIDHTSANNVPATNTLAGDERGRDVPGFTFANEYIKGGSFIVTKLYDGDHSDRTKLSHVKVAVYSEAAKSEDAWGCCLTYRIEGGGVDRTNNTNDYGAHAKLDGVNRNLPQENDFMVVFDHDGWAYIEAELKEDSYINITGEFGPFSSDWPTDPRNPYPTDNRMELSLTGLLSGQDYYVIEATPGDYRPTGYIYVGEGTNIDPRKSTEGMTAVQLLETETTVQKNTSLVIPIGGLLVEGSATGGATTVYVVNKLDENKVSPTGIFINNLPYILMVGIPVAVFATMFVIKRRGNASA